MTIENIKKLEITLGTLTKSRHQRDLELLYGEITLGLLLWYNCKMVAQTLIKYEDIKHPGELIYEIEKLSNIAFDNECTITDIDKLFEVEDLIINIEVK